VLGFAGLLMLLQWRVTWLPLVTVAVFLASTAVFRMLPWRGAIFAVRPGSWLASALLFGLFVRHFAGILETESRRVLTARGLCVSRNWGPGGLRSLAFAVAALASRTLVRAERFYAAQRVRGLGE
jgi:hypothetical protein